MLSESQDNNTSERNERAADATPMSDGAEAFAASIEGTRQEILVS